jgi:hypothetical protein
METVNGRSKAGGDGVDNNDNNNSNMGGYYHDIWDQYA